MLGDVAGILLYNAKSSKLVPYLIVTDIPVIIFCSIGAVLSFLPGFGRGDHSYPPREPSKVDDAAFMTAKLAIAVA